MEQWFEHLKANGGPVGRPLLVLSDIHGDLDGLEAVLASVEGIEVCGIVAAGDHCVGGEDPLGVWLRLQDIGATLTRGESDWALGALASARTPLADPSSMSHDARVRFEHYRRAKDALGDILCRRLSDLPSTAVVSLDDNSGVMVMHGMPKTIHRSLEPDAPDDEFEADCACIAEDVLVVGRSHQGFVRRANDLLVVGAGSVGESEVVTAAGERTARASLILPFRDGSIRVSARDIVVQESSLAQVG